MEQQTFTREQVESILVSVFVFASANNNQGVKDIKGQNYGEMAQTVIKANESIYNTDRSILSVVQQFR
jgi:hypothetical protein